MSFEFKRLRATVSLESKIDELEDYIKTLEGCVGRYSKEVAEQHYKCLELESKINYLKTKNDTLIHHVKRNINRMVEIKHILEKVEAMGFIDAYDQFGEILKIVESEHA